MSSPAELKEALKLSQEQEAEAAKKQPAAKRTTAKKTTVRKKTTARKSPAKKTTARKKTTSRKSTAKKATVRKKTTARKRTSLTKSSSAISAVDQKKIDQKVKELRKTQVPSLTPKQIEEEAQRILAEEAGVGEGTSQELAQQSKSLWHSLRQRLGRYVG